MQIRAERKKEKRKRKKSLSRWVYYERLFALLLRGGSRPVTATRAAPVSSRGGFCISGLRALSGVSSSAGASKKTIDVVS